MKVIMLCLLLIGFIILTHFINGGPASFRINSYGNTMGYLLLYPYGVLGTLMVFEISRKQGGHIPILSHIGRYSIIVLIMHIYVIMAIVPLCKYVTGNVMLELVIGFALTIMICYIIINPVKNYLGYFTAQKDLINVGNIIKDIK